jgi:hypothetical protein
VKHAELIATTAMIAAAADALANGAIAPPGDHELLSDFAEALGEKGRTASENPARTHSPC